MKSNKIILDTSILLMPYLDKVDIFSSLEESLDKVELYILDSTIKELEKIARRKDKKGIAAKIALLLVKQKNLKILPIYNNTPNNYADQHIITFIQEHKDYFVATLDKELIRKIKEIGGQVLIFNSSKKSFVRG